MTTQPKWQRARFRGSQYLADINAELWVQVGPPEAWAKLGSVTPDGHGLDCDPALAPVVTAYVTNLRVDYPTPGTERLLGVVADQIELLARDEKDFLFDDPPFELAHEWLAKVREEHQKQGA